MSYARVSGKIRLWDKEWNLVYEGPGNEPIPWYLFEEEDDQPV